jgi:hypothetical protein
MVYANATSSAYSQNWEFSLNERLTWYWRSRDRDTGLVIQQAGDFQTLFACVKDAERNGYRLPLEQEAWYGIPV